MRRLFVYSEIRCHSEELRYSFGRCERASSDTIQSAPKRLDVCLPRSASLLPWGPVGRWFGSPQAGSVARSDHHNRMTSHRLPHVPEILNPPYPPRLDPLLHQFHLWCESIHERYPVRLLPSQILPSQIPFLRISDHRRLPSMIGRA